MTFDETDKAILKLLLDHKGYGVYTRSILGNLNDGKTYSDQISRHKLTNRLEKFEEQKLVHTWQKGRGNAPSKGGTAKRYWAITEEGEKAFKEAEP